MNIEMAFLKTLFRMPIRGYLGVRFRMEWRLDLGFSLTSASSIFRGRKKDAGILLPMLLTRNPRLPYSLLKVCITREFSPTFVVWSMMMSVLTVISCKITTFLLFLQFRRKRIK